MSIPLDTTVNANVFMTYQNNQAGVVGLAWVGTVCYPNTSYRASINEWFQSDAQTAQVSILPTFYTRLFRTKVLREAFLYLNFRFELLLAKEYWRKCAYKMLVKLTPGVNPTQCFTDLGNLNLTMVVQF